MAEPKEPREPRIPKESPPFDADNKWTRVWIMYFESLFSLSVKEAVRQSQQAIDAATESAAAYTSPLIAGPDTTKTITGATHKHATAALLVQVYDNASPRNAIAASWTVNASTFDVIITFASPQSNYYVVIK